MAVTEESRHLLHQRLEERLGPSEAITLMEHLPPVGWADVATRRDLDQLHALTVRDLAVVRSELKGEIGELRSELKGEIGELRSELKEEIGELRSELKGEIGELRTDMAELRSELLMAIGDLRSEIHHDRRTTQRQVIGALVVALVAMVVSFAGPI
ncbi:hypothetical protein BH23ACT2_BH23ACT2_14400 [soil metagenome]